MKRFLKIFITFLAVGIVQLNAQTTTFNINTKKDANTVCGYNTLTAYTYGTPKNYDFAVYANDNYSKPLIYGFGSQNASSTFQATIPGGTFSAGLHVLTVTNIRNGGELAGKVPNGSVIVDGIANEPYNFNNVGGATIGNPPQVGIQFGTLWDDNYIYIAAKFVDNTMHPSPTADPNDYNYDSFELYLDPLTWKKGYGSGGGCTSVDSCKQVKQLRAGLGSSGIPNTWPVAGVIPNSLVATHTFSGFSAYGGNPPQLFEGGGWVAEFKISWLDFYGRPTAPGENFSFGYMVAYNNNINGTGRDEQVFWPIADNFAWTGAFNFGTALLGGYVSASPTTGGSTFIDRGDTVISFYNLFVQAPPVLATDVSITGDCLGGMTVKANAGPPPGSGEAYYWQTYPTGTLASLSNSANSPFVTTAPPTVNGISLRSLDSKGCWSAPLTTEFIPRSPGQYPYPITGIVTNYLCTSAEFIASVPGMANNVLYWQTTSTGMDMTNSATILPVTVTGYSEKYLRALNTVSGCWSNGAAFASVDFTGEIPKAPAIIKGAGILGCFGFEVNYRPAVPPKDVVWYWQLSTVTAPVRLYATPSFYAEYASDYYLRAELKGCWSDADTIRRYTVTATGLPDIRTAGIDAVTPACEKTEVKLSSSYTKPSVLSLYWEYNPTDTLSTEDASVLTISVTTPGLSNIYLRAKDNTGGCWSPALSKQIEINARPPKPANPTGDTLTCDHALVNFTTVTGSDYTSYWESADLGTGDSLVASGSRILTASGTYFVRARNNDAHDCWSNSSGMINVIIEQIPVAPASLKELANGCGATTITSSVVQPLGTKYFWQVNDTSKLVNNPGQNFAVNKKGTNTYYVRARTDKAQCWSDSSSIAVTIGVSTVPSPIVSITSIEYTHNDPSVPLTVAGIVSPVEALWYTDTSSASATATAPSPSTETVGKQTYYVSLIQDHCESPKTTIVVNIVEAVIAYDKGNWGITPNGDAHNDAFVIDHIQNFKDNKLTIVDKWGNKVYEMTNYDNKFAGKHDDKDLPIGTYYYVLDLRDGKLQAGTLTILR